MPLLGVLLVLKRKQPAASARVSRLFERSNSEDYNDPGDDSDYRSRSGGSVYTSGIPAASRPLQEETFPETRRERAAHRDEDIKGDAAIVEECVPKVHDDLHHRADGLMGSVTPEHAAVIQSNSAIFVTNTLSHSSA